MKFFRRKVSIFGKAIPITVILLLIVTVVVAGAFFLQLRTEAQHKARGIAGSFSVPECNVSGSGWTITECELDSVIATGLDDDSTITWGVVLDPDPDNAQTVHFTPDALPAGVTSIDCFLNDLGAHCDGVTLLPGHGSEQIYITITVGDLVPDQVVDPFGWTITCN